MPIPIVTVMRPFFLRDARMQEELQHRAAVNGGERAGPERRHRSPGGFRQPSSGLSRFMAAMPLVFGDHRRKR
jgi:hypothetical protein